MQLSSSKETLITKQAQQENRQIFNFPPNLSELNHLLVVVVDQLKTYELWPVRFIV